MKAVEDMSREELEEEVAFLRSELGLQQEGARTGALMSAFGLTAMEAQLVAVLYGAKGRPMARDIIEERMAPARRCGGESLNTVNVYVCRVRKRLGQLTIQNIWGKGYAMTPGGLAKVSAALEGAA